jgi:hypothetical protein
VPKKKKPLTAHSYGSGLFLQRGLSPVHDADDSGASHVGRPTEGSA